MAETCRHRRAWLIAGGAWAWCYECGAIRLFGNSDTPIWKAWVRPTGKGGENPYPRPHGEETK